MEVSEFIACEDMFFLGQTAKTRKALGGRGRVTQHCTLMLLYISEIRVVFFLVSHVSVDLLDLHLAQLPSITKLSNAAKSFVSHL